MLVKYLYVERVSPELGGPERDHLKRRKKKANKTNGKRKKRPKVFFSILRREEHSLRMAENFFFCTKDFSLSHTTRGGHNTNFLAQCLVCRGKGVRWRLQKFPRPGGVWGDKIFPSGLYYIKNSMRETLKCSASRKYFSRKVC